MSISLDDDDDDFTSNNPGSGDHRPNLRVPFLPFNP
jgi:hypothetical protein